MWKFRYALAIFLITILLTPNVLADGGFFITYGTDQWSPSPQKKQVGIIDYKDGKEELTITISTELGGNSGVWIFPIPAKPEETAIDVVDKFPEFSGYEVKSKLGYEVSQLVTVMAASQFVPFGFGFGYMYVSGMFGSAGGSPYAEETGVTVYEHLERGGLTTELVTAESEAGIGAYMQGKGLNLPQETIAKISEYIGNDFSFVISWISNIAQYQQLTGGSLVGVKATFPTSDLYYPMKLTSVYGETKVPMTIYVMGRASPRLYDDIADWTRVGYYGGKTQYTKISIKAPSSSLQDDLWMSRWAPADIMFADIALINPLVFAAVMFAIIGMASSVIAGHIIFKDTVSKSRLALLGLANFLTSIGFLLATYRFIEEKGEKADRTTAKIFFATLVIVPVLIFLSITIDWYEYPRIFGNIGMLIFIVAVLALVASFLKLIAMAGPKRFWFVIISGVTFLVLLYAFGLAMTSAYPTIKGGRSYIDIDPVATYCTGSSVNIFVRNVGSGEIPSITVTMTDPSGNSQTNNPSYTCEILYVEPGESGRCSITRPNITGSYRVVAHGPTNTVTGSVYCQ